MYTFKLLSQVLAKQFTPEEADDIITMLKNDCEHDGISISWEEIEDTLSEDGCPKKELSKLRTKLIKKS